MNVMNNIKFQVLLLILPYFLMPFCSGQIVTDDDYSVRGDIRIMFYNVENFFDAEDDSLFDDSEFLSESDKNWTDYKFHSKSVKIFKTIAAIGENRPPEIICFAEVENRKALEDLCWNTPLEKYEYSIVHFESPDRRGIDVALIYNKEEVSGLGSDAIRIPQSSEMQGPTRDILYFKALTKQNDTLHLFVNHWPSRRGGQIRSEPKRMYVADMLRSKVDSILSIDSCANIVITGDFNDEPTDRSVAEVLGSITPDNTAYCNTLYNLSSLLKSSCKCGTYKYRGSWNMIDQFIVSGTLLHKDSSLSSCLRCIHIADFGFLLLEDEKFGGWKPDRTYLGPVYKGGSSDHLPVYLDLYY